VKSCILLCLEEGIGGLGMMHQANLTEDGERQVVKAKATKAMHDLLTFNILTVM
jgi:hypothetical protein